MIRLKFVIFGALGLQIIAVSSQHEVLTRSVMLVTYPLLIILAFANGRLFGMRLILAGALLNFIVMAANGGLMPVSPASVARTGDSGIIENIPVGEAVPGSKSILLREDDMALGAFADRIVVDPPAIGVKVVSVGDLLIGAGLALATAQVLTRTTSSIIAGNRHV